MHVRVWPSTVQVMVVVPEPAGRTTPSEEMVATAVLPMDQVGVEEVPFTRICTEGLSREEKGKSVWFRDRVPVEELPENLRTAKLKIQGHFPEPEEGRDGCGDSCEDARTA